MPEPETQFIVGRGMKFGAEKLVSRRKLGNLFLDVNLASKVKPTGQALGTTSDPSIFTRNPERVAPGHGQGPNRGVGCYSLIISLKRKKTVRVGKLGVALFPKGTYVYTGSAMGGLAARLKRHLTRKKKIHWHIDYLLKAAEARVDKVIVYPPAPHQECRQNQRIATLLGATVVLKRFGASDCKSGCASHLFFFTGLQASLGLTAEAARFSVSRLGFELDTQDSGLGTIRLRTLYYYP